MVLVVVSTWELCCPAQLMMAYQFPAESKQFRTFCAVVATGKRNTTQVPHDTLETFDRSIHALLEFHYSRTLSNNNVGFFPNDLDFKTKMTKTQLEKTRDYSYSSRRT
jgi:hypothetical protein